MDFYEWRESDCHEAEMFRMRIKAGETGNSNNPMMAAKRAYAAGIKEGKRLAAERLIKLVTK